MTRTFRFASALPLALIAACSQGGARGAPTIPVSITQASRKDVSYELTATGTVEPRQTAQVEAQVTGIVTRVAFHEGDEVAAGQLLFQIDPRPFQAALAQAVATMHRDSAQALQADRDADRYAALVKQDYVTQEDYDTKRAAASAADATVRADSANVAAARLNLDYASVTAPIGGRTGGLLVKEGNLARANSATPLVVINQIRPILVRFAVPQANLPQIQRFKGNDLKIRVNPNASGDTASDEVGHLTFLDNAVDTSTGTLLMKGEFPNEDRTLWPGQFVNVRLELYTEKGATVIPSAAVTTGQTGTFVFVVNPDQTVTLRPVTVERTAGDLAVISQGIKAGETVVTDGQVRLASGSRVSVKNGGSAQMGDK
ncbi:MAG TPA: efflux RND transporter periplasmic adaptor subunit [Gemmatimonadales bacterium]|nr:efflux RND transporter periplasmic adaptor subunit [Gemmatimonadales bacterium]